MSKIKKFFAEKAVGFYVGCAAALLFLLALIVYGVFGGERSQYFSAAVVAVGVVGIVLFAALCVWKGTAKFAPLALWLFMFVSTLIYINAVYMYLTEVFFSGVSAETLALMSPSFLASTVLLVVAVIAGNVAMWMKQLKGVPAERAEAEPAKEEA